MLNESRGWQCGICGKYGTHEADADALGVVLLFEVVPEVVPKAIRQRTSACVSMRSHSIPEVVIKATQPLLAAIHQLDLRAVARKNGREFHCDVSSSHYQGSLREFLKVKRLI